MNCLSDLQQAAECLHINDLPKAEELYKQVLRVEPTNGHAYLGMGKIALEVEQYDKAVSILTKCCELLPNEVLPLIKLSEAFNGVNSEVDGLTTLEYAAKSFPNNELVHYYLALQYIMLGDLDKGEQSLKTVLKLTSNSVASFALFELIRLNNQPEQYLPLVEWRLKQKNLSTEESTVLHYALGNVLHNTRQYQQAWLHFENANLLQAKQCDFKTIELQKFFQEIKVTASQKVLSQRRVVTKTHTENEITPIFIVGLPRTGSTLLEQLLTEHQDIASAGEAPYLSREVAGFLFSQLNSHYPYSMTNITDEQLNLAAKVYLDKMAHHAKGKRIVIDKLPANFQSIGLIYKLFPNAKVLHIQRNLPDVALSIYRNYFSQNEPYFCSLSEFKQYYTLYSDLMAYWRRQLPGFILDLNYEQLVEDKTHTIKTILDFCSLSPLNNINGDFKVRKVFKTLSNIQVRAPIINTVMHNWENYAEQLSAFIKDEKIEKCNPLITEHS